MWLPCGDDCGHCPATSATTTTTTTTSATTTTCYDSSIIIVIIIIVIVDSILLHRVFFLRWDNELRDVVDTVYVRHYGTTDALDAVRTDRHIFEAVGTST